MSRQALQTRITCRGFVSAPPLMLGFFSPVPTGLGGVFPTDCDSELDLGEKEVQKQATQRLQLIREAAYKSNYKSQTSFACNLQGSSGSLGSEQLEEDAPNTLLFCTDRWLCNGLIIAFQQQSPDNFYESFLWSK